MFGMDRFGEFFNNHWLNIALILLVAYLFRKFAMIIVWRVVARAVRPDKYKTEIDEKQRQETLNSIISTTLRVGVWIVAALLILSEIGVNIAPLVAGAGVAGVALGFGAQSMVKDFLAGVFIIVENQYRVGDVVQINQGVAGIVEHLSLRETVLRDIDGMLHHVPNGYIEIATNMTMEYANVNLDIGINYDSDIDKVENIINQVGLDMANDQSWKSSILEAPAFVRIEKFDDSAIIVKIMGKTAPMQQWAITGELRKRLKKAFDKAGIVIPFPQRVIHTESKN